MKKGLIISLVAVLVIAATGVGYYYNENHYKKYDLIVNNEVVYTASKQVVMEYKVYSQKDIDDLNKKIREHEKQIELLKNATTIFAQKK